MSTGRNHLAAEKSPYLLQHKDNPVWWRPWGVAAFDEAGRRDVPVFLSVGYSTCHWCHVMEHESFEDLEVAAAINEGFVAIKVDREERPDVDAHYMQAVQAMTGRGGWPMSVFLTPDGRPFFGGTYFTRMQFLSILEQLGALWRTDRQRIERVGADLAQALASASAGARAGALDGTTLASFLVQWRGMFDRELGGRRGAPKFPPAYDLQLLLRIHRRSGDAGALEIVTRTLDAMAAGGICDHVGGGFHRYSTDEMWLVPHFEKMLYDQAALAGAYLDAFQATGVRDYELVTREILDYVLREMTHRDGGFYSAEDADSEGEEGKFYVWTAAELRGVLAPAEFDALAAAFAVAEHGSFEHGANVLSLRAGQRRAERSAILAGALAKLRERRDGRVRPHLDDKILADWNGLMIAALARAGRALDEPRFTGAAARAADFLLSRLRGADGRLRRRWRDGEAAIGGFLDDYAFVVHGLIELHQSDFDPRWLDVAVQLQGLQEALFWDDARGDYFFTDGADQSVLGRAVAPWDNVTPAGRSVAALNLLRLSALTGEKSYAERAARVFASTPQALHHAPAAFSFLLAALDYALDRSKEVAIVGRLDEDGARTLLAAITSQYQPNQVIAAGPPSTDDHAPALLRGRTTVGGRATAYVCEHGFCSRPTTDPREAAALAATYNSLSVD